MANFKVMYEIDITASTAMAAALEAEQCMRGEGFRPMLVVRNTTTDISETIDLEEI